ncbi:MAG: aspartate/glutamate racemase family protein [Actinobacteria bacterium]|nr:aspartate/glutamate racemase family protein [Actinomycetota bacterium]
MAKKVALIHTGFALVEVLKNLFSEIMPGIEIINILDDSLLREVLKEGSVTKPVIKRMISYFKSAEVYKVDAILNVCSSVGEVADIARIIIDTPIVKIDEKMAEEAVARSSNIGVAATLKTTLDPTCRLLEKKAEGIGKKITITRTLCPGAFEELINGNGRKHDEIVLKEIEKLSGSVEIIVLAQGSMARLTDSLSGELSSRVLSSLRSGVMEVKRVLGV